MGIAVVAVSSHNNILLSQKHILSALDSHN